MRVAVLTLTRDRLPYTQHCFQTLHRLAGCDFDHYVFDQGSQDGTPEWLGEYDPDFLCLSPENVGISRALNKLLDWAADNAAYDAIVKFDNDCELATEGALWDAARFVVAHPDWLISPTIMGLNHPPHTTETVQFPEGTVLRKPQIGGIFLAAHASVYESFRYDESNPTWGLDDAEICRGRNVGYLVGHVANHYETTEGQKARFPEYWERKMGEMR